MKLLDLRERFGGDDRGISPVIGVVLMIAIFVILIAAVGAFVLGFSPTQSPPNTEMAYIEEGAAGVGVQVVMDVGDDVEADNLGFQLDDGTNCNGWSGDGTVDTGDETVLAHCDGEDELDEGDTVQVIWSDDTGSRSSIIDSYELQGSADLADDDCDALDLESDPIEVKSGETIACDIGSSSDPNQASLTVENNGVLIGNVDLDEDFNHDDGGEIIGDVNLNGDHDLDLKSASSIAGDLKTGPDGSVDIDDGTIGGTVDAGGDFDIDGAGNVGGSVNADGDVTIPDGTVGGAVNSEGAIDIDDGEIGGSLNADGDLDIDGGTVGGDIDAGGDVTIPDGDIDGNVKAGSNFDITDGVVDGDVYADGNVNNAQAEITGTAFATGDITIDNNGVIDGHAISEGNIDNYGTVKGEDSDIDDSVDPTVETSDVDSYR